MSAVIDRFAVRWRAHGFASASADGLPEPGSAVLDTRRLDRLVALLLDGSLEDALERAGIGHDEELCVRQVVLDSLTFRWPQSDADIVAGWSRAISERIRAAASGDDRDVVRYRSLPLAVFDLVAQASTGDLTRAWAWRQLGLWMGATTGASRSEVAAVVAQLLTDHPTLVAPSLARAAAAGHLRTLAELIGPGRLAELAAHAWRVAGGQPLDHAAGATGMPGARTEAERAARALVARSALARAAASVALASSASAGDPLEPSASILATALAVATVLHEAPAAASGAHGVELAHAVARRLVDGSSSTVLRGPGSSQENAAPRSSGERPETNAPACDGGVPAQSRIASTAEQPAPPLPAPALVSAAPVPAARRTDWGGLVFLLHILDERDIAIRLAGEPVVGAARLRVALHRLASDLLARAVPDVGPPDPRDPVLLAFCGLPGHEPPPLDSGVDSGALLTFGELVASAADEVIARLRERLAGCDLALAPEPALLLATCRRRAVVEAEPGWVDVILELGEVSVDIRRAGLDLDPGYLPWLGCVVRVRYA
ncbi:MAG: hypothetical protein ACRDZO_28780, partial [Egibacteraceae bacterium]